MTGLGGVLGFVLRRDRVPLTAWMLGTVAAGWYFLTAISRVATTQDDLAGLAVVVEDPMMRLLTGPGYGLEQLSEERLFAGQYLLYLMILMALMNMFLLNRHTRVEEQSGRAELLRANVVGRHVPLVAGLIVLTVANVLIGLSVTALAVVVVDFPTSGSALVGLAMMATGMLFAGLMSLSVQVFTFSRAAAGAVGALLGTMFLIRGGGDLAEVGGSWLSWVAPLGWPQQTAPYVEDRVWPALLTLLLALTLNAVALLLSTRRDLGSGLIPPRPGRPYAPAWQGSTLGIAARMLRSGLRGWGAGMLIWAVIMASFVGTMEATAGELPPYFEEIFPPDQMVESYLAMTATTTAMIAAGAAVSAMQHLRAEELSGRTATVLSAPVSRWSWLGAHLVVLVPSLVMLLAVSGALSGLIAWAQLGDAQMGIRMTTAFLHQTPAMMAVLAVVVMLLGWWPRAAGVIGWLLVGYAFFASFLSQPVDLPEAAVDASLFAHLADMPFEEFRAAPFWWMTGTAVLAMLLGSIGWRRREIVSG